MRTPRASHNRRAGRPAPSDFRTLAHQTPRRLLARRQYTSSIEQNATWHRRKPLTRHLQSNAVKDWLRGLGVNLLSARIRPSTKSSTKSGSSASRRHSYAGAPVAFLYAAKRGEPGPDIRSADCLPLIRSAAATGDEMILTMSSINLAVLDWANAGATDRERVMTRNGTQQGLTRVTNLTRSIAELVESVRSDGDAALVTALRTFDGVEATPDSLRVREDEFAAARAELSYEVIEAIRVGIARSQAFNEAIVQRANWSMPAAGGTVVGEVARPIESVGLFVPSGKGSYPSVLIQIGTPAVVAGVSRIAIVVPPNPTPGRARVDAATLVVAAELGIDEVYCLNGPSGVAALAVGTETVLAVGKIVGPGSPAVTIAQQLVQSMGVQVAPGLGPTDSLIIADSTADPVILAADFLSEAEHGVDSSAVLVSTDRNLLEQVANEVETQWRDLPDPRRDYAKSSISDNGGLVLAASDEQALEIANAYASEHVQLAVADPEAWLAGVRQAGTVLLGQWTPFSASSYSIGTPATLPTTGFAKSVSGVTAHTYLTKIATAAVSENDFWTIAPAIEVLAAHEGFPAHRASVTVRRNLHGRPASVS